MKKNNFSERLCPAMDARGIKSQELSRITGIDKSSISCYRNGKYKANSANLYILADALRVNPAWLMGSNEVPMDIRNATAHTINASNEYLSDVLITLDDKETMLIERYRAADDEKKRLIAYLLGLEK